MLVAAPRKGSPDARHIDEHLEELTRLVDTAGAEVVGRISQQIAAPSPATLIGEGKVEEVGRAVADAGATLVIFDEELSPVQGANLERELKVRVMDRPEVILDIFSRKATRWEVHATENGDLAKAFIEKAIAGNNGIAPGAIHADNGTSMTSKTVTHLLADLQVSRSHCRPPLSNHNPYYEKAIKNHK